MRVSKENTILSEMFLLQYVFVEQWAFEILDGPKFDDRNFLARPRTFATTDSCRWSLLCAVVPTFEAMRLGIVLRRRLLQQFFQVICSWKIFSRSGPFETLHTPYSTHSDRSDLLPYPAALGMASTVTSSLTTCCCESRTLIFIPAAELELCPPEKTRAFL
jgi:hypothetical protein